jgi:hypothetical protein
MKGPAIPGTWRPTAAAKTFFQEGQTHNKLHNCILDKINIIYSSV